MFHTPYDWESWLVANINDKPVTGAAAYNLKSADNGQQEEPEFKTGDEINAMTKKADVIAYAESIGLSGLSEEQRLDGLKTSVLNFQEEIQDMQGE